jgi:glucose/arabinose dehydrogenase
MTQLLAASDRPRSRATANPFRIAPALFAASLASALACSGDGLSPSGGASRSPDQPSASKTPTGAAVEPRLQTAAGFRVTYFARNVPGARFMALGPDGSVYLSQSGLGQVTRLRDADGDGVAEIAAPAVTGLDFPHGLALRRGYLYIANTGGVVRVRLRRDGMAAGAPEQINSYSAGGIHSTRTIIFGRDGDMYVSIGSTCNICVEQSPDRAAVMRYDEDGKNGRLYGSGLRNAVGLAVHPITGRIWATQNERDFLAPNWQDLPPDEINILRRGGDYGWPYCYGRRIPNPEFNDQARCARTIPPALELPAHAAPLGITFLNRASSFPARYRDDALVAYHGSWNRDVPVAPRIVRIEAMRGRPKGVSDFITGWQNSDGSRWGRPVDVIVDRNGSVLISDDHAGVVYRVSRSSHED